MSGKGLFGAILIVLGVLYLLDVLGLGEFGEFIADWWPLILIYLGMHVYMKNKKATFGATILLILGFLFLFHTIFPNAGNVLSLFWPILLIVIGIKLLSSQHEKHQKKVFSNDYVNKSLLFAADETKYTTHDFRGGKIDCFFAACELDLRDTDIKPGTDALLEINAFCGGVEIIVPKDWTVTNSGTGVLGSFQTNTGSEHTGKPKHLTVKGSAVMGGVEIST